MRIKSEKQQDTIDLGTRLARHLKRGDILCLLGDLGAGKTTFVKGLAKGLRINPAKVNSPTFVLMNAYKGKVPLYHFDFYRLEEIHEIASIGYDEFLYGDGVAVVEWAERFGTLMPKEHLEVALKHQGDNGRMIKVKAKGERYVKLLEKIKEKSG